MQRHKIRTIDHALAYMSDCQIATASRALYSRGSKKDVKRHIAIAQIGVNWINFFDLSRNTFYAKEIIDSFNSMVVEWGNGKYNLSKELIDKYVLDSAMGKLNSGEIETTGQCLDYLTNLQLETALIVNQKKASSQYDKRRSIDIADTGIDMMLKFDVTPREQYTREVVECFEGRAQAWINASMESSKNQYPLEDTEPGMGM